MVEDNMTEFRIETVMSKTGEFYKVGAQNVHSIKWEEEGNILVHRDPVVRSRGDSDCRYFHAFQILIPFHNVAEVHEIAVEGTLERCRD